MITASEYRIRNAELLTRYEASVRQWLKEKGKEELSRKVPFFRDAVVCPEKWFAPGNDFRPLFILKEASLGKDHVSDLDDYLETWGHPTHFEFVENPFDDVQIGIFTMWKKIAALAKGMEEIHNGGGIRPYDIGEFGYEKGEEYKGPIQGYHEYGPKTANSSYNEIIPKIAVMEIKKVGGGRSAGSELSLATLHYSEHVQQFEDLICEQIALIDPTVVICCSREFCTWKLLKGIEERTAVRPWIYGYHPTYNSTENFYTKPLEEYLGNQPKK